MSLIGLILVTSVVTAAPVKKEEVKYCSVPCAPKKAKKKKSAVKVVKEKKETCCAPTVIVHNHINTEQHQSQAQSQPVNADTRPNATLGIRGAVGLWTCEPNIFGLVGLRAQFPKINFGLDASYQFDYGLGLSALAYPIQTKLIDWHLNAGILTAYKTPLAVQDVPRNLDLTVGTGLEVAVLPFMDLTFDWRYAFPPPWVLNRYSHPNETGRIINSGNVMGNALYRSQFMVGVLFHTI